MLFCFMFGICWIISGGFFVFKWYYVMFYWNIGEMIFDVIFVYIYIISVIVYRGYGMFI